MNGMGEHTQFQDKHDRLDCVVREFAYLLLVAPKNTIWCILMDCIVNRLIVPNVLKVLRRLPAVLELELELGQVEGGTSKRSLPLITAALRIIASKEKASLVSAESRASFIYLVSALVREKRSALKNEQVIEEGVTQKYGEVIDKAVLDGNEVLLDFVLPLLFSDDDAEIALGIMCRMFGDYDCKRTPIRWDVLVTESNLAGVDCFEQFPVPMCMMALVDILSAVNGTNAVIEGLCLKCLCLLGEKLKG
ncbi:unnamed protein product [Toxocara canis]|uniref:HEAT repeat-containing protein 1 n=1 Tax=Toxocara canis TaxID=6265 RepID=A0A183VD33_TOXCA|nr:unnamed protein product [Toxocara canis]